MVDAAPMNALRYDPAVAGSPAATSAPAYDVVEPLDYARHRTANPYTVMELLAPPGSEARARRLLAAWRRSRVLVPEGPAFLRYEQHELAGGPGGPVHSQRGILAAVRLEPAGGPTIVPHEDVCPERVASRLRQLRAVPAETDPVCLLLDDPPEELTKLEQRLPRDRSAAWRGLARRGERLPYKSTRFLPKPRTGLIIRPLDDVGGTATVP